MSNSKLLEVQVFSSWLVGLRQLQSAFDFIPSIFPNSLNKSNFVYQFSGLAFGYGQVLGAQVSN